MASHVSVTKACSYNDAKWMRTGLTARLAGATRTGLSSHKRRLKQESALVLALLLH
jgi:hypothetical protein